MKKKVLLLLGLLLMSCNFNDNNSVNTTNMDTVSENDSNSSDSESELNTSIDYSKFDTRLIGSWYINTNSIGLIGINIEFIIKEDYTLELVGNSGSLVFNYVGIYEGFEEANLFATASKNTYFIASIDEDNDVAWGVISNGEYDFGFASKEKVVEGINYQYATSSWPMEIINTSLSLNAQVPSYESDRYYVYVGHSQIFDSDYAMIDIFNTKSNAIIEYCSILESAGFTLLQDEYSASMVKAYDKDKQVALRVFQTESDNLSIFFYPYSAVFA